MNFWNTVWQKIIGGRPMRVIHHAFEHNDKEYYYWVDCFGRIWMASNRWGWDRERIMFHKEREKNYKENGTLFPTKKHNNQVGADEH